MQLHVIKSKLTNWLLVPSSVELETVKDALQTVETVWKQYEATYGNLNVANSSSSKLVAEQQWMIKALRALRTFLESRRLTRASMKALVEVQGEMLQHSASMPRPRFVASVNDLMTEPFPEPQLDRDDGEDMIIGDDDDRASVWAWDMPGQQPDDGTRSVYSYGDALGRDAMSVGSRYDQEHDEFFSIEDDV